MRSESATAAALRAHYQRVADESPVPSIETLERFVYKERGDA